MEAKKLSLLLKEHQRLLMRRESRIVMGRKAVNLWLLTVVLLATFLAIAFSAGSMAYLNDKMNDPFTNWVNVELRGSTSESHDDPKKALREAFDDKTIQERFNFVGWQGESSSSIKILGRNNEYYISSVLFYDDMTSDIIAAVLSEENVVGGFSVPTDSITSNPIGLVATLETMKTLGYDQDHIPAFIDLCAHSPGADSLGVKLYSGNYARSPLPLLAVVKRLPMNKEMIGSKFLYSKITDNVNFPFNLSHEDYTRELRFFIPNGVEFRREDIVRLLPDSLHAYVGNVLMSEMSIQEMLRTWKEGKVWMIYMTDGSVSIPAINDIEKLVLDAYKDKGVERVYGFNLNIRDDRGLSTVDVDDIYSVHFTRLDSIRPFERFVKEKSGLQIEMTQVNSKENFNAVSVMATILSAAMIVFSIVCIVIFLTNMLQSYFQKVRRNLGTFKAFGMSTRELMRVYVLIIVAIVVVAIAVALAAAWVVEALLPLLGVMKDSEYSWLILWNARTLWAVAVILVATVVTVVCVMQRLLRQTPGDLIYDR